MSEILILNGASRKDGNTLSPHVKSHVASAIALNTPGAASARRAPCGFTFRTALRSARCILKPP